MKMPIKFLDKSVLTKLPKENFLGTLLPRLKEEKNQKFTTLVMTLMAIAIFGFFAISPTLTTIAQLNKQLEDDQFVDQKLTEKITDLASLQEQYAKLQNDIPVVTDAIPADPSMAVLVGQLQAIADDSSVSLQRIQTFPVDITTIKLSPTASTSYGVSMDIQGTLKDLGTFLTNVTTFDRLISLDTISAIKQSPTDAKMRMTIKGSAFFKQQ